VAFDHFDAHAGAGPVDPAQVFVEMAAVLGHAVFTICAWSMAGMEAMRFAAAGPPGLARLVLVDVVGLGGPLSEGRASWTEDVEAAVCDDPAREWARRAWRSWVHRGDLDTTEYEELTYRWLSSIPGGFERNLAANRQAVSTSLLDVLERVAVPTLVLAGRYSLVLGPEAGAEAVKRLRYGRLVVFEGSAHALPLEEPERFQEEVARFVCT
jgi:pimeloyl-ACP methyl ester carboxylesterase